MAVREAAGRAEGTRRSRLVQVSGGALLEIPRTIGVVGAVLVPVFVAVGAIAALAAAYTLDVDTADTADTAAPTAA